MEELQVTGWTDEQKAAFCLMQFQAQDTHYKAHYPEARFDVIQNAAGVPVGRLYVKRTPAQIHVIDISLLTEHRGQGIGTHFLRALQEEAAKAGQSVSIHVEQFNPAQRLYERLKFQRMEQSGIYYRMEWKP